jgi:hypothetical protein
LAELSPILFPHSEISSPDLERVIDLFGELTICKPWFMEAGRPWNDESDNLSVHVLLPPEGLRPRGDFKRLLSEYQLWIRHNQDRGYAEFLKATQEMDLSENTLWEIRQTIRQMEKGASVPKENNALKWHLILHLARKIEEDQVAAETMIKHLKRQKSPLEEAIGEGAPVQGLFDDLMPSESQPLMDKNHLRQISEAWVGLFGEYLPNYRILITVDRHVIDFATDIFEEQDLQLSKGPGISLSPRLASSQNIIRLQHLPLLADGDKARLDPVLSGLSGKSIILFGNAMHDDLGKI